MTGELLGIIHASRMRNYQGWDTFQACCAFVRLNFCGAICPFLTTGGGFTILIRVLSFMCEVLCDNSLPRRGRLHFRNRREPIGEMKKPFFAYLLALLNPIRLFNRGVFAVSKQSVALSLRRPESIEGSKGGVLSLPKDCTLNFVRGSAALAGYNLT